MNHRIVITGATGFVGSNLVGYFLKQKYDIYVISRENSNLENLKDYLNEIENFVYDDNLSSLIKFFDRIKPSCIFHLASSFIAEHEFKDINILIQSNITFGLHILEAMKETGLKKIINTGTSWQHFNNENYNPVCLYAATKQAFESLIDYYVTAEDFKVITLKLFDTYGEDDNRPKLINLLHKFADEQTVLKMSPGKQMLNLVHISDVCSAFFVAHKQLLNENDSSHKKYGISNKISHDLKSVVSVFEEVSGKKINITWGGRHYRKREVMTLWNKGETLPKWEALISLKEGLKFYN
jgi:nucleoside-diphosphate-sugar epimerase